MVKNLLSVVMLSAVCLTANAYNVDDYVYTRSAKYQVTAANLVTNGDLKTLDGWTSVDEATPLADVFTVLENGGVEVNTAMTAFTNGMYQAIDVQVGGTYVVTMKIKGTAEGCTDIDMNAAGDNYINAYYNTDGALATVGGDNNTTLSFGENGACSQQTFSYTADDFTEIQIPVEATAEGKIVIDLRGMQAGLQITDIECHLVSAQVDERVAQARLNYVEYILNGFDWTEEYDYFVDVQESVAELKAAIEANDGEAITVALENLNGNFEGFAEANLANVLNTVNGGGAGNNSANWMNWTAKYNKLISDYKGTSGWTWTTDRWCHKTAAAKNPMAIQWMRGSSGTWDNIATLPCTLDKGTYFFSVEGQGGMMTKNKNRWARHNGYECAQTEIFFGVDGAPTAADTLDCGKLPTTVYKTFVNKYTVAENETAIKLGIRCNQSLEIANGFDVWFSNPAVYKVLVKGELTPAQKTYLGNVETQIAAVEAAIANAEAYVAADQKELPWGKEDLQKGIDATKARLEVWKALGQQDILDIMDEMEASYTAEQQLVYNSETKQYEAQDSVYAYENLNDVIMNAGVRYLNNNFVNPFKTLNTPLTDMPVAIAAAKETQGQRIYSGSAKMADLTAEIAKAQALYDEKVVAAYSEEAAQALVDEKAALAAEVEAFKNAISIETLADIDFNDTKFVEHVDETGETDTYYSVDGKKGQLVTAEAVLPEVADNAAVLYELGYHATDSLGMLRVGGKAATVAVAGAPVKETDIVRVSFDFYFGSLITKSAGYLLTTEEGDTICGLVCSKYSGTDKINTFAVDYNSKINSVGSSSASNAAIAASSNATHFEVVLDYGKNTMYCTTSGSKGTVTTAEIALPEKNKIANFVIDSDYNNADRRCWFDNLKVENIAADAPSGINEVATEAKAQKTGKFVEGNKVVIVKNGVKYNVAGAVIK